MKTHCSSSRAMTLMQALVVIAIVIVLLSIAYPIWAGIQKKKHGAVALSKMKQLGTALTQYISSHDGTLPDEESADGKNDWKDTAEPAAENAWYNCLPRQLNMQGVGDYQKSGNVATFYTDSSLLYLPGADYPHNSRMRHPLFAYAFNTKLQRKPDKVGNQPVPRTPPIKLKQISKAERTVVFLEQGLRGEKRSLPDIQKKYDGEDCKASAKQFIARSGGKGIVVYADGNADLVAPKDVLESGAPGGQIKWNADSADGIVWTLDPKDDPN